MNNACAVSTEVAETEIYENVQFDFQTITIRKPRSGVLPRSFIELSYCQFDQRGGFVAVHRQNTRIRLKSKSGYHLEIQELCRWKT